MQLFCQTLLLSLHLLEIQAQALPKLQVGLLLLVLTVLMCGLSYPLQPPWQSGWREIRICTPLFHWVVLHYL